MSNSISKKAPRTPTKELVINWHMTEVCNYSCTYCFAKWGRPNELHRSTEDMIKLLDNLADYFINGSSSLKQQLGYETVRLNFAGGEPMLLRNTFIRALKLAKEKGFKTSIITNGYYLVNNKVTLPENTLDMIGISFDSLDLETRKNIGRQDRKGNSFGEEELKRVFLELKKSQKGIETKINTVVNSLNCNENFSQFIKELKPNKWKVFQVMPSDNDELIISREQFNQFIRNHSDVDLPIYPESSEAMTESYLMIDPQGRFYQNSSSSCGYNYSENIIDCGVETALNQVRFNPVTFASRYQELNIPVVELKL